MRVVAIIQARMGSTRLPGKVLMPLSGVPVLEHVVQRVRACATVNEVVVATSNDVTDDVLADWCNRHEVEVFRGSLTDVLDRYYHCAERYSADAIVRITADCPAVDPIVIDGVVSAFLADSFDLFYLGGEFPDGLDCAVFSKDALSRAWREATLPSEREHVGPYITNHPEIFKIGQLIKFHGLSHHRWTLDEPRDLSFLQVIFSRLNASGTHIFHSEEVLQLLQCEPEILNINGGIVRNEGLLKSVAADGEMG
jgi:spore coat polysaccharide biosynthesis protein SpsF (cytidylyltransferase family)